jgi:hypothetical protein
MNEFQIPSYLQPLASITTLGLMLRFMVVSELKRITAGLNGHEKRIRRQEIIQANLRGSLLAKGCLRGDACLFDPIDEDGEGE